MINRSLCPLPSMHLLMLTPGRIPSTQILDTIFAGLADQGTMLYRTLYENEASCSEQQEAIWESDIVFFFRSYTPGALSLLRFAKELGKMVIYSTDDDLRALDPSTALGQIYHHPENLSAYACLFQEADLIWLFTQEMRRRYSSLNQRVVIGRLPSFVECNHPDLQDTFEVDDAQSCVIGYGGRRHHHADWQLLVRPLLQVLDSYTHVRAEFVEYAPEELSRHPKARVLPLFEDLRAYYEFLRQAPWT